MNTTKNMGQAVVEWAKDNDNVRVVMLTSSRTNPNAPVDALSDYDIELFVKDFKPFLDGDDWLANFGDVLVREPYKPVQNDNLVWRLVMFKDAPRIDFAIQLVEEIENEANASKLDDSYDIGYKILLDKDGITKDLKPPTHTAYRTKPPTESEYDELVHHFWWNITYVAKYLYRDELFFAKYMLDDALHHKYLNTALAWHIGMKNDWQVNTGAFGRWFKQYLDAETWAEVESTFVGANPEENWQAMFKIVELFEHFTSEVGAHLGYTYPSALGQNVTAYLKEVQDMSQQK